MVMAAAARLPVCLRAASTFAGCCGSEGIFHIRHLLAGAMRVSERLVVGVTFDERRGGYVATGQGLATVTALSLSSLRKRIEAQLPPTEAVKLELDRVARRERDRRRASPPRLAR
jgi:hypothetical protein